MPKTLEQIDKEIAAANQKLARMRESVGDFELAIATLKQPVAASLGVTPTETMLEIIGEAETKMSQDQRLKAAEQSLGKHREEIIKLEKECSELLEQRKATEKQLQWEEIYEPHVQRLRQQWTRPPKIEQKILKNIALMEQSRTEKQRYQKQLDGWEEEKRRIEQVEGLKTNPNHRQHLQEQLKQAEATIDRAFNEIKMLENVEEMRLFKVFVEDTVDFENALNDLRPQIQKLQRLNTQYRKQAADLQSKIEQKLPIRYIKVPIPTLPEEFNYEFK